MATQKYLKPTFVLWKQVSKDGKTSYFTGKSNTDVKLVGFYNGMKKNPNEPDLRVYLQNDDGKAGEEVASLWCKVSEKGNKYLTGKALKGEETHYIKGFINKSTNEKAPYLSIYLEEELNAHSEKQAKESKEETKKPVEAF